MLPPAIITLLHFPATLLLPANISPWLLPVFIPLCFTNQYQFLSLPPTPVIITSFFL
jgi:hypothetical protein